MDLHKYLFSNKIVIFAVFLIMKFVNLIFPILYAVIPKNLTKLIRKEIIF